MLAEIVEELAPTGVLRAAINMSNFLLVTGKTDDGDPVGFPLIWQVNWQNA